MSDVMAPPSPPRADLRKPWRSLELLSLDFEATGLDMQRDRIISFGAVPIVRGGIDVGRSTYDLVDPGDVRPSRDSIVVHGLRPLDLVDAPPVAHARLALRAAIGERFLVTWWARVEAAFLDKLFANGPRAWMRRAVDVRDLVIALEGRDAELLTLTDAAERFGVPVADPHHALDDALVTAQLFLVAATKLGGRAGSVRDMLRLRPRWRHPTGG